jgi:mannose-6-phosphate isomerase-like protein (cupin superfamily)
VIQGETIVIKKALLALLFVICGVLLSQDATVIAQDVKATRAKAIAQADIQKGLKATNGIAGGESFQIVPDVVIRRRLAGPNNASVHSTATDGQNMTEVMVITDGSGTIMTGGTYVDQAPEYQKKDRTKGITGGVTHDVKAGDVIVVPAGTAHWFPKINGQVTMIEARLPVSAPAKFMTKAEVMKQVAAAPWGIGGQTYSIISASGPAKANSIGLRHREKGRGNDASIHSTGTDGVDATEVMIILDGGGTFMSDGTHVDTNPDYASKDRTKGITGGVSREVKAGDVLVYPPGTSHWFSNVSDQVTMIEVRLPGDVTKGNQ